ncbi:hypothetical protein DFH07DRAFT_1068133 [Mycena maculata]|uniref:F-box domain-containing protein n=1 Tax=Mycena maculata TaxID=230809 RepID=A0AAD7MIN3_9AGAR|nr:hypothetical protein DFH07DRAFT_1068133 [Mycena maculata]
MTSFPEPILPPEVIDLIIDDLHDHPLTLRACSLVSRNWLATSRHHLFDELYLTRGKLYTFRDLLTSPRNTVSSRLRSLHATGLQYDEFKRLWPLLPAFPHLRSLHLHGNPLRFEDETLEPQSLPNITLLSLSHTHFASYRGLKQLFLRFPSLKILKLGRTSCDTLHGESRDIHPTRVDLDSLHITLTADMLGWLKWTGFSLRADCVEMELESMGMVLSEYLEALGSHLKFLTLKFETTGRLAIFSEQPRLRYNTALRSLKLTHAFWMIGDNEVRVAPALPRLLQQLESSRLEELVFNVLLGQSGTQYSLPQAATVQILDGAGFMGLRRVEFHGAWDRADDILRKQFESTISTLLPTQYARGIVHSLTMAQPETDISAYGADWKAPGFNGNVEEDAHLWIIRYGLQQGRIPRKYWVSVAFDGRRARGTYR